MFKHLKIKLNTEDLRNGTSSYEISMVIKVITLIMYKCIESRYHRLTSKVMNISANIWHRDECLFPTFDFLQIFVKLLIQFSITSRSIMSFFPDYYASVSIL